jgi:nucleotide-binding universal stress UspA family protein
MENKKIVLVPTDFSDVCLNAIIYGAKLASLMGHSLLILHVIDSKTKSALKKEKLTFASVTKKLDALAKKTAGKHEIQVDFVSREGNIFTTIADVAKEASVNFMVLGTHGKTDLKQKISGSYAKKLLLSSPVPVIVVQKNSKLGKELKNIVFPVSTTAEVRQKVKWAVIMAKAFNSKVHLFQLQQPVAEDKAKMQVIINQIAEEFDKNSIPHVHVLAKSKGGFGRQVQAYANQQKADLISIMTTPDKLKFKLNAYDEKMIFNQFEIPVMCLNPVETTTSFWF